MERKNLTTTEIVQRLPNGKEEVKYRRKYGSDSAKELMKEVDGFGHKSGYFYRHV